MELEPVDYYCPQCDSAMEWTACYAPTCKGYRCLNCDAGCDLYDETEDGQCARAIAGMPWTLIHDMREERRLYFQSGRPVRTVRLPGECS